MDDVDGDFMDSVLCNPGSRIITLHSSSPDSKENLVLFINAGGEKDEKNGIHIDGYFRGGYTIKTDELIENSGELVTVYQTARFGNCVYHFDSLTPGNYCVDLFFAEIVITNGPRGIRVFNVYIQEEKVVNELDVFSVVGANKPMQVEAINVLVGNDGTLTIRFEGVVGTPIINGIRLRKPSEFPSTFQANIEGIKCNECSSDVMIPYQLKVWRMRNLAKYEGQIKELKTQLQRKADECHEAWMSLSSVNHELEEVKTELDKTFFRTMLLDQTLQEHNNNLRIVESGYEHDRKVWENGFAELEKKIKTMKKNQIVLSLEAHECARVIPDLNEMVFSIQSLVTQYEDLKVKFNDEQMKRKELHNQLQEAKGNIRVFCRCRPLSKEEEINGHQTVIDFASAKYGDLEVVSNRSTKKSFKFDRVFAPEDDQAMVYLDASPIVMSVLDGYNASIFAYGQTGTGKTFTMEGSESNRGVNYRTLEQLFQIIEDRKETFAYEVSVSVLEVYNEQVRDLLATSSTIKRLEVKQRNSGFVESRVSNVIEAWDVLQAGSNARVVGSNNVNERSSRSHCLLCTFVKMKNLITGECTISKLWLVDLAGSERLYKTEAQGERLKEAQNINRSLSALGDVISSLASKSSHIPYRNSKLTHLLQDSLGGDSKTLMFVQISPSENDVGETLSSLNFATRVRGVELGPIKKQIDTLELQKTKAMLEKVKQEVKNKEDAMKKMESHVQNLEQKLQTKDQILKNQNEKTREFVTNLTNMETRVTFLNEEIKKKENDCSNYRKEIKELEDKLKENSLNTTTKFHSKVTELNEVIEEKEKKCVSYQQEVEELKNKVSHTNTRELQSQMNDFEKRLSAKTREFEERMKTRILECNERVKEIELKHKICSKLLQQQVKDLEAELAKKTPDLEEHKQMKLPEIEQPLNQINLNCSSVQSHKGKAKYCELSGSHKRELQLPSQSSQAHKVKAKSKGENLEDKGKQINVSKRPFARIGKPTGNHSVGGKEGIREENKKHKVWLR